VGAAKWDTEPSSAPAWGGIVALRGFEIAGEGTVGFMTSYDVALGYNEKNQIPHDMAFAMGAGLRFGPVVLAPGLGLGLDGVNGGDANAFRVPTAFYWKLDGRLLLHVGPISLEGQGARVRRGSMLGSANAVPNETRLLGRLHTPILGERRLSLGLELIDYETGKSLTGLLGMHL